MYSTLKFYDVWLHIKELRISTGLLITYRQKLLPHNNNMLTHNYVVLHNVHLVVL